MMADITLEALIEGMAMTGGPDFRGYRRSSLERRIRKRMSELKLDSLRGYADFFTRNRSEINLLQQTLLINETTFFRDPAAWEALTALALPRLLDPLRPGDTFRAWCAGCATGEEAFSLAILLAEYLGPELKHLRMTIQATDVDEEALDVARKAEYPRDRLKTVGPELREKYLTGTSTLRVNSDIRRMVTFHRSSLTMDGPIAPIQLVICRNVLIYFDRDLQKKVIDCFSDALTDGGVLFLGRAESPPREYATLQPLDRQWRIFQRGLRESATKTVRQITVNTERPDPESDSLNCDLRSIVGVLSQPILLLDPTDTIVVVNEAARRLWQTSEPLEGMHIASTILVEQSQELREYFQQSPQSESEPPEFELRSGRGGKESSVLVRLLILLDARNGRAGTLIYAEDVCHREQIRGAVRELEATGQQLRSSREALEITNEELQSTNEELENTNSALQSMNEELETTNEELHSLNEELEAANDELEMRTRDLDEMNRRYAETLEQLPSPVMLVNKNSEIVLWNSASERLFGVEARLAVGEQAQDLPLPTEWRNIIAQGVEAALREQNSVTIQRRGSDVATVKRRVEICFAPVGSSSQRAVLVIVNPMQAKRSAADAKSRVVSGKSFGNTIRSKLIPPLKQRAALQNKEKPSLRSGRVVTK